MHYTYFEFRNFKGIRRTRLDLSSSAGARVFSLVGLNESGKTTVLEAIDHFTASEAEDVSPKQLSGWLAPDEHSLIPIADRTNFTGNVSITCGIELDDDDVAAARRYLKAESDGYRLESLGTEILITDKYSFEDSKYLGRRSSWTNLAGKGRTKKGTVLRPLTYGSDTARWQQLARFLRSRLPTIWYFPNFLFDFPERIYLESHNDETPANAFYRALFSDILGSLGRDLDVQRHVVDRARSGKASDHEHLKQTLLAAGRHVTGTVVSAWNQIFTDKPISQKRVVIDSGEDGGASGSGDSRLWIQFSIEDADGLFAISERSLGFRWFFVYLLVTTYCGRKTDEAGDMLFLFDEPASNLHPAAQAALLRSFSDLSHKAVVLYTTHSHHLIEPRWLGSTYVVANAGLDAEALSADFTASRADIQVTPYRQFAANHPNQHRFFQPILDVLDYRPSELELVPGVLMVEGKSDFYLLSYFQDNLMDPAETRVPLLPGGGAGTLDEVIQLYLGWSRPFVALLDGDAAGKEQQRRYSDKFGPVLDGRLLDLASASGYSAAKGIESIMSTADKLRFQSLIAPSAKTVRKKTLALGVQEALITGQKVRLSEEALARFENILSAARACLDADSSSR